jgi:hypothetical protein
MNPEVRGSSPPYRDSLLHPHHALHQLTHLLVLHPPTHPPPPPPPPPLPRYKARQAGTPEEETTERSLFVKQGGRWLYRDQLD